jgi:hypothetical protein
MRVLAIGVSLFVAACAPGGRPPLVLDGLVTPDAACVYGSQVRSVALEGALDTSTALDPIARPEGARYTAVLRANSILRDPAPALLAGPGLEGVHIESASVRLALSRELEGVVDLSGLPHPYTVPATGFLPYARDESPETTLIVAELLPVAYAERFAGLEGTVTVSVTIHARTTNDDEVSSDTLTFPVRLCDGCLLACGLDQPSCTPGQDAPSSFVCG